MSVSLSGPRPPELEATVRDINATAGRAALLERLALLTADEREALERLERQSWWPRDLTPERMRGPLAELARAGLVEYRNASGVRGVIAPIAYRLAVLPELRRDA